MKKALFLSLLLALLSTPAMAFKVNVESCSSSGNYTTTEGYVTNTNDFTAHFITVRLVWTNKDGNTIDTGSTYAVGIEMLHPGESSRFSGSTRARGVNYCNAGLLDYRKVR